MIKFAHQNFNVADIDKSIAFYQEALGLKKVRQIDAEDGSFTIVFMTDEYDQFRLTRTEITSDTKDFLSSFPVFNGENTGGFVLSK